MGTTDWSLLLGLPSNCSRRHQSMTTWTPPETEDSPDVWDALSAETSSRWSKAHPLRAALASLVALKRRKQGREAGWPHLLELVSRKPLEALLAYHRWRVYLERLRAEDMNATG